MQNLAFVYSKKTSSAAKHNISQIISLDFLIEHKPWNREEWYNSLPDIEFEDIMPASFWKFLIRNIGVLSHKDGAVQKFNSNFHNKQ